MVSVIFLALIAFAHISILSACACACACPKCGSMEVPYPLTISDTCGNPNYRLYCNNGNSLEFLSAGGTYYKVLSINNQTSKLIITPPNIQTNTCQSSDLSFGGFRIDDSSPFNISSRNTVMLLHCAETILLSPLNCSSNSVCRQFEERVEGCKNTICCSYLKDTSMNSHKIRVRVGGCTAYTSVVDLKVGDPIDSWNYGIELQWSPPF